MEMMHQSSNAAIKNALQGVQAMFQTVVNSNNALSEKIGKMDQKVGQIDQKVGQLDQKLAQIDGRVKELCEWKDIVIPQAEEAFKRLQKIEERTGVLEQTMQRVAAGSGENYTRLAILSARVFNIRARARNEAAYKRHIQSGYDEALHPFQIATNSIGVGLPGFPEDQRIEEDMNLEIGAVPSVCPTMIGDVSRMSWGQINYLAQVHNTTFYIAETDTLPEMRGKFRTFMTHGECDE